MRRRDVVDECKQEARARDEEAKTSGVLSASGRAQPRPHAASSLCRKRTTDHSSFQLACSGIRPHTQRTPSLRRSCLGLCVRGWGRCARAAGCSGGALRTRSRTEDRTRSSLERRLSRVVRGMGGYAGESAAGVFLDEMPVMISAWSLGSDLAAGRRSFRS
jgi:hypothetical protein